MSITDKMAELAADSFKPNPVKISWNPNLDGHEKWLKAINEADKNFHKQLHNKPIWVKTLTTSLHSNPYIKLINKLKKIN